MPSQQVQREITIVHNRLTELIYRVACQEVISQWKPEKQNPEKQNPEKQKQLVNMKFENFNPLSPLEIKIERKGGGLKLWKVTQT